MWTKSVLVTLSVVLCLGFGLANQHTPQNPGAEGSTTSQSSSSAKLSQDAHFLLASPSSSLAAPLDAPSFASTSQVLATALPATPDSLKPPVIDERPIPSSSTNEPEVKATQALKADGDATQTHRDMPYQATASRAARSIESAATSKQLVHQSGEGRRAPRVSVTAVGPQSSSVGRRSEPQITDFIGGIVKLLGGGPQPPPPMPAAILASLPGSRPGRPQGTRINNRGPPRITDVSLPNSTNAPPFPFERPISGMGPPPLPRPQQRPHQHPVRRPLYPDGPVEVPPELADRPYFEREPQETSTEASTSTSTTTTTTTTTTEAPSSTTETSKGSSTGTSKAASESTSPLPVVNEPSIIESSMSEIESVPSAIPTTSTPNPMVNRWSPRPGLVLDDPEFKPGGVAAGEPPQIITAPVRRPPGLGEVFDVTVSAIQGPSGQAQRPEIVTRPQHKYDDEVSIDGRKSYINLLPSQTQKSEAIASSTAAPASSPPPQEQADPIVGLGVAVPSGPPVPSGGPPKSPPNRRPAPPKRPPVRIDTCIVGDQSTCDSAQNEACRTEAGVSSCHCKPGHSRRKHREPCRRIVSLALNLKIDRVYEKKMSWSNALKDQDSDEFQQLSWEVVRALDSAMGMTPFSDDFMGARVNAFTAGPPLVANMTLQLAETAESVRPTVRHDVQRHLLGAITRRNNNVGDSAVWVDKVAGAVSAVADLDECISAELNDCHPRATCTNVFGTFRCACAAGLRDPWAGNVQRSGRQCESCPADFCNNRGECSFAAAGERVCACAGNYFGSQCEMDGEVLGVAIGAAVAAVLIIGLTLFGLCMWSRKWNREQQKVEMMSTRTGLTSPVFSYMAAAAAASSAASMKSGMPPTTPAAYVTVEDRLRWAHIADVMAQNHYAPEPNGCPTRPSSAVFYPSLPVLYQQARPPPPPTHGPPDSSDEEDNQGLLGRNFQVPRPRSRAASIANQSGIYYDLDYDTRPAPVPAPRSTLPRPPPIPMAYMQTGHQFYRG